MNINVIKTVLNDHLRVIQFSMDLNSLNGLQELTELLEVLIQFERKAIGLIMEAERS